MSNARRLRRKGQRRRRPMPTHSTTGRLDDALVAEMSAELGLAPDDIRAELDALVVAGKLEPIAVDIAGHMIGGYRIVGGAEAVEAIKAGCL